LASHISELIRDQTFVSDQSLSAYDQVPYPSLAHVQTHPDRLATIAALFGLQTAPVEKCRVLELGCGDGTNLISMAHGLLQSEFFGIDSAGRAITEGHQTIDDLSLDNVRLQQLDLMEFAANDVVFDYIIAHGVYSWVPDPVRDRILAICSECLSPNGVAYVSYNTYPGGHIRDMVREMMLFHVRGASDAEQKIAQGRALLKFLASSKKEPDLYRDLLEKELEHAVEYSDAAFYHDDLNPLTRPIYFHQFVEHAAAHGLQFLGDAMFNEMQPEEYEPAVMTALRELDNDILAREQYLDFLMGRRFRRTLLCRREVPLDHKIQPGVIANFYVASEAQPTSPEPSVSSNDVEEFRTRKGASIRTNRPLAKAALLHLSQQWPRSIFFPELLAAARRLAFSEKDENENRVTLCEILLRSFAAGVTELHVWAPSFVTDVSEHPIASPVARHQNRRTKRITTLRHTGLELNDALSRNLLELLDGTRDFAALVEAMAAVVQSGKATLEANGKPVTDPAKIREMIAQELPSALHGLARSAVLVG
jgi:methyltransferase-like protein/2-polyprenyl-3-methyl-5-hydroxy-6-metoxy-1,4-benzoquinol methylase